MSAAAGSRPPSTQARRAMADTEGDAAPSRPTRAIPDQGRRVRRFPWRRVVALVVVVLLLAGGVFAFLGVRALDRLERDPAMLVDYSGRPAAGLGTNYLVLAAHTASASATADVIMLVHLNDANDKAYLISLPRDFYLTDNDGNPRELQAIYAEGGASSLQRVLESSLDARIDHMARLDYEGFIGLTSQLGGVVVNNPVETTTPAGIHFAKGPITVSGEEALAYVADNSNFPNRATVLAQRQQDVMRAIVLKTLRPETILNPVVVNSVLRALAKHVAVDESLTTPVILQQAISLRIGRSSDIVAVRAPILGTTTSSTGGTATLPDPALVTELSTALRTDTVDAYQAAHPG